MKRYIITNGDGYLHSNNCFYNCVMGGFGINLVVYKNLKSAQKRATKLNVMVLEVEQGQTLKEGRIVGIIPDWAIGVINNKN
jgi:hypothetical protein